MSRCGREIPARHILCFMFFTGFTVVFLLRVNINLAIVGMVRTSASEEINSNVTGNATEGAYVDQWTAPYTDTNTSEEFNSSLETQAEQEQEDGEFLWDEFQQSVILGAFFWGYMISQIPGGRIAEIYGTKPVFGFAVLINGVLSLLVPVCARLHWLVLFCNRVAQGLAQGVLYPALSACIVKWVPLDERAKFVSITVQGCSLGPVVAMPLCGWILTTWGWPAVFYVCGVLTCAWYLAWIFLVYDSPQVHPRISSREKKYLEEELREHDSGSRPPFPWRAALLSSQFWVGAIAHFGSDWGFHTFYTFGPKYMKSALGFDIEKSALLSSVPFLCQYLSATLLGILADFLVGRNFPLVWIRKSSVIISHWMPGILVIVLTLCSHDVVLSVFVLTAAVTMLGALTTGYYQNHIDIAPNFAGSLTGIANTLGALTGIVSTPIAGSALKEFGSPGGWNVIFYITAAVYGVTSIPFLLWAKSKELPWNRIGIRPAPVEMNLIKHKSNGAYE